MDPLFGSTIEGRLECRAGIVRSGEWDGALPLCSQLRNWSLNQSQESGVACPRNHFHYNSLTVPV